MGSQEKIGYVCYKGPHAAFAGEDDYGACGSKTFANIYVVVDNDTSPRGEHYSAEDAAAEIRRAVADAESNRYLLSEVHEWMEQAGDADPNWSGLEAILARHEKAKS